MENYFIACSILFAVWASDMRDRGMDDSEVNLKLASVICFSLSLLCILARFYK